MPAPDPRAVLLAMLDVAEKKNVAEKKKQAESNGGRKPNANVDHQLEAKSTPAELGPHAFLREVLALRLTSEPPSPLIVCHGAPLPAPPAPAAELAISPTGSAPDSPSPDDCPNAASPTAAAEPTSQSTEVDVVAPSPTSASLRRPLLQRTSRPRSSGGLMRPGGGLQRSSGGLQRKGGYRNLFVAERLSDITSYWQQQAHRRAITSENSEQLSKAYRWRSAFDAIRKPENKTAEQIKLLMSALGVHPLFSHMDDGRSSGTRK